MQQTAAREVRGANERRLFVVFLWASIAPPALLTLEDAWAGAALRDLVIRGLPALVGLGALAAFAIRSKAIPVRQWGHWIVLIFSASLLLSNAVRPESALAPLRGRLLGPALIYLLAPNSMLKQAGPAIGLSAGFIALRAFRIDSFVPLTFINDALFLLVINVAGVLRIRNRMTLEHDLDDAWNREHTARTTAEQAMAEVRTLQSIIPICMHCRKLRTDAGQWQLLETYVREHTGSQFSHGLCPECLEEHYPDPGEG